MDIDQPILRDLKRLQKRQGKSLGRLMSDLLAEALSRRRSGKRQRPAFRWIARPLHPRVDLDDKEALYAALDGEKPSEP